MVPGIRVVKVVAMVPNSGAAGGTVKTDVMGVLTVERRKEWTTLEMGFIRGWAMCVKADAGVVAATWPADVDGVRAVGGLSDPGERIVIDLMKRQTFLYLDRTAPGFRARYQQLETAYRTKVTVAVAVAPGGDLIEDVIAAG